MPTAALGSANEDNETLFQLILAAPIEQYTLLELYEHAETIKDDLLDVNGIKNVYLGGNNSDSELSYEITISVDHTILA